MKGNKLLAEYLGNSAAFRSSGDLIWCFNDNYDEWQRWIPDKDWNQLMMVVEKIRKELNDERGPCQHYDLHDILLVLVNSYIGKCDYTIEEIANACVEYIKSKK